MRINTFFAVFAISTSISFFACSSNSSTSVSNDNATEVSSSGAVVENYDANGNAEVNTEETLITSSSSHVETVITENGTVSYNVDADGFVALAEVYKNLQENESVAFILRHAERESSTGIESELTENGVLAAIAAGEALKGSDNFYYASSGFVRTTKTCEYIAEGRNETGATVHVLDSLDGNWFSKVSSDSLQAFSKTKGGTQTVVAKWVYTGNFSDLFYDFETRANEYISDFIVKNMPAWGRVSILCTHDLLVMPLVAYASNKEIDMQINKSKQWIYYIAGLAVITDSMQNVRLVPVKGMDVGVD